MKGREITRHVIVDFRNGLEIHVHGPGVESKKYDALVPGELRRATVDALDEFARLNGLNKNERSVLRTFVWGLVRAGFMTGWARCETFAPDSRAAWDL